MIEIEVLEYYNVPAFYRYMPESILSALEEAYLEGSQKALVPEGEFNEMINSYKNGSKTR